MSAQVPMLIGSTLNEFANEIQTAGIEAITEQEITSRATAAYGDAAARVIDAYRTAYPGERPSDTFSRISAAGQRHNAITQATRKAALGAAPAFLYWFTWQTPILDGRPRAFHCAELPFVFNNADRCAAMTGGTAEARELAGRMSDAWIAFARTGNPGHAGPACVARLQSRARRGDGVRPHVRGEARSRPRAPGRHPDHLRG